MKPYQQIPILDCGESLVPIPLSLFAVECPHPYVKLAAPYGDQSPYWLRQEVLNRLLQAQETLQQQHPGWQIQIFDAYRPIAVQQFMVDYTFTQVVQEQGLATAELTVAQRQEVLAQVHQFWAVPSLDPATPPPHSTGAALDVTLVDAAGQIIDMGSPIDELSPRSYPDHYRPDPYQPTPDSLGSSSKQLDSKQPDADQSRFQFHRNRQILKSVMTAAQFEQHPQEWWHFSYGDQLWAWLTNQKRSATPVLARYGRI